MGLIRFWFLTIIIGFQFLFISRLYAIDGTKPFRRALIISCGGITPGVGLGIIAAAEKSGWTPDLIITTCGASMSAMIYHRSSDSKASFDFLTSREFFKGIRQFKVRDTDALRLKEGFKRLSLSSNQILPDFFIEPALYGPETLDNIGFTDNFKSETGKPKILMIAAKALFGKKDADKKFSYERFAFNYFTDSETAGYLKNYSPAIPLQYPNSYILDKAEVTSDKTTIQAMRGSIADPFVVNPGRIDDDYYLTGASDLYPYELAKHLADEVYMTYPDGLFKDYEDKALKVTFGYSANKRLLQSINESGVKWIDIGGRNKLKLDPKLKIIDFDPWPALLQIVNQIPSDFADFYDNMRHQWDFGFSRMQEALKLQKVSAVESHIRTPISKSLYKEFSCKNALEWKTYGNTHCENDWWPSCDRTVALEKYGAKGCTPIR